jgi:DNA-binding SARP family transcriptional activator/tetratricopeptide (TPR) repeat protein
MPVKRIEIYLCGEPQVRYDGRPWRFKVTASAWTLLAMLVTSERPIARELLAATLWPDYDRAEGLTNLRRHLHMIVRGLPPAGEPWVVSDNKAAAWNGSSAAVVDVEEFARLLAGGRDAEAVEIYRGELLPEHFDDVIVAKRERLRSAYLDALERLIARARTDRAFAQALAYADRLLATDEWREEAVRAWMAAKYESGDATAALNMYDRLVRRLRDEFSAAPTTQTAALRDVIAAGLPLPASAESAIEAHVSETAQRGWKQPFVGRAEPLDRLSALWSRTARGNGGVAFISGVAGIGKSRLAAEFATLVRERGGRVLVGATSNPESEPYEAVAAALRDALDGSIAAIGDVWLATLARVIPAILSLREGLALPEESSLDGARGPLFEAVVRVIEHLGRRQPVCLVLEDLHWAGPGTIDLLATLARRVGTLPVAVVVTYRTEESHAAGGARGLRTRLVHERRAIACPLERLNAEEVSAIVDASVENAGHALRASVAAVSEGNPLFVAQLVANYLETGAHADATAIPRGVGDAIAARLRLLDASVRAVAEMAATIGTSFRIDLLAATGEWPQTSVLDALGALMDRAIVRETGAALEYVFTHSLLAATLYSESSMELRAARHRLIATLLERDLGEDAVAAGSVARHWQLAGEWGRAARAYLRAATRAVAIFAYEEALAHCTLALELGADRDLMRAALLVRESVHGFQAKRDEQRADLLALEAIAREDADPAFAWEILRRRTLLARATDDLSTEAELITQLAAGALALGDGRRTAEAHKLTAAHALAVSDGPRARGAAHEALRAFEDRGDEAGEIEMLCLLARIESDSGDLQTTQRILERVRSRMRAPDRIALLNATMAAATAANFQQHFPATLALAREALELSREIGYKERGGDARNLIGIALTRLGDFSGARDALTQAHATFAAMGRTFGVAAAAVNIGVLEWRIGRLDAAHKHMTTAKAHLKALKNAGGELTAANNLAGICIGMGRFDEAVALARESLGLARRNKLATHEAAALCLLGYAARCKGNAAEAIGHLEAALSIHRHLDRPIDNLETLAELALAHLAAGNGVAAAALVEEFLAAPSDNLDAALWPQLYHWVAARVYRHCGKPRKARLQLDAAAAAVAWLDAQIRPSHENTAFLELPLNRAIALARNDDVWP